MNWIKRRENARACLQLAAMMVAVGILTVGPAEAQVFGKLDTMLQSIVSAMTGTTGKALATIGVIIVGLMWVFGQLDVRKAGGVILGIAVIFGSAEIVSVLTGG